MNLGRIWNFTSDNCAPRKAEHLHPSSPFGWEKGAFKNFTTKKKKRTSLRFAAAKSLQSCPTLCDPMDGSPPGSPVPGILQARILEWVAISFFNAWKWKRKVKLLSRAQLLVTQWTAAHQTPLSMGFSRQEYGSGLPLPSLMICSPWKSN